jgi:hypothetical protein
MNYFVDNNNNNNNNIKYPEVGCSQVTLYLLFYQLFDKVKGNSLYNIQIYATGDEQNKIC